MIQTIDAVFDGMVFRPIQPITLAANTRVQISVTSEEKTPSSFLDVAEALSFNGPTDWSTELDKYLYGDKQTDGI